MRTAIIGAGRRTNGIGRYIGRYFHKNGAEVVSVLGTSGETAREAASCLEPCGINAAPFSDFHEMLHSTKPDTVVIASPASTHYEYLLKCIEKEVNIFCEKPFIWQNQNDYDAEALLEPLFEKAGCRGVKIGMNSQWPFSLPFYEELCGSVDSMTAENFLIRLSPAVSGGEMIPDSVPHALSLLYSVMGPGRIEHLSFGPCEKNTAQMSIVFNYISSCGCCGSAILLEKASSQPREFSYGFNGRIASRLLELEEYKIYFEYMGRIIQVTDPLELSVRDFISAVSENREPLAGREHIINNTALLKEIYQTFKNDILIKSRFGTAK